MKRIVIYVFILTGCFYFSEGKPCPEKTRMHKTRCDAYYKCTELPAPSKTHVWVPVRCEQGLVYEHNIGTCVLPEEEWECLLGENNLQQQHQRLNSKLQTNNKIETNKNEEDIDIVSTPEEADVRHRNSDDGKVEIVLDGALSSEEDEGGEQQDSEQQDDSSSSSHYESSGDGELVEMDGFLQAENRESVELQDEVMKVANPVKLLPARKEALDNLAAELKQVQMVQQPEDDNIGASNTPIDPNLTAHLQRLSQLIDGLKKTYQEAPNANNQPQEMRPDQLNAFLSHFNIKNGFETLTPSSNENYKAPHISTTTAVPRTTATTKQTSLPVPTLNKTQLQEHLSLRTGLEPETKVVLHSGLPKIYGNGHHDGYSNSQIVVNRPEGSVLFTLPSYGGDKHYLEQQQQQHAQFQQMPHDYNEPKISEETLKTVLELSKQMIAAQNVQKVMPNPAYYAQPIYQPVILAQSPHGNPFANYYQQTNENFGLPTAQQAQSTYGHVQHTHSNRKKPHRPTNGGGDAGYGKQPSTTIIHNNVIPVHVSTTNSGEKEVVDSYGNSLGLYPPLHAANERPQHLSHTSGPSNNNNDNVYEQHMHYSNNNFVATITTARPAISVTTMSTQYPAQYPSPYGNEITITTPRPFEHQPTSDTIATYYTPSPHLGEHNVNRVFQTESYTNFNNNIPRPFDMNRNHNYGMQPLFPASIDVNKVKIRPNSQKIESMEVEADELINNYGGNTNQNNNNNYNNNGPQILTYSSTSSSSSSNGGGYGGNHEVLSAQLATSALSPSSSSTYVEHTLKHPYMPRPTPATANLNNYNNFASNLADSIGGSYGSASNFNSNKNSNSDGAQLVNFNGNFISLDVFRNSILPFVGQSNTLNQLNNVEVITCQAGVRQPNTTDCTRYFVCSKKDGKVLSYSCPPYTAFNQQTRICDASTYAHCSPVALVNSYTVQENKRLQQEAIRALEEAKKRQEAALKAQNLANLFNKYGNELNTISTQSEEHTSAEKDMLSTYMQQAASMAANSGGGGVLNPFPSSTTTTRPNVAPTVVKKRKYYCKEGDKIPDQTSINNYFVCYKNAQGHMKGHKMTCSRGLLFCPKTTMCTLPVKCS